MKHGYIVLFFRLIVAVFVLVSYTTTVSGQVVHGKPGSKRDIPQKPPSNPFAPIIPPTSIDSLYLFPPRPASPEIQTNLKSFSAPEPKGVAAAVGSIAVNENPTYNTYTPAQLVQNVLITGCLTASNVSFIGAFNANVNNRQLGYFNKATSDFPIDEGLILSSGYVTSAVGPNNSANNSQDLSGGGDADLSKLAGIGAHTYDAAVLEFDFVPAGNTLEFQYIFSSEEYLEYCCSQYNDAFGFFLSGPGIAGGLGYTGNAVNIALIPATTTPVTINNVHSYVSPSCPAINDTYYTNNPPGTLSTQFDGMTVVLTATYTVQACLTYHIKLAVADVSDRKLNSAVFLKARSFNSQVVGATNQNIYSEQPDFQNIFEGCSGNSLIFTREGDLSIPYTFTVDYTGSTATNGIDIRTVPPYSGGFGPLPTIITFPANESTITIPYEAVNDGIPDPGEFLRMRILQSCPCDPNPVYLVKNISIFENDLSISSVITNNIDCGGAPTDGTILINTLGGSGNFIYSIDGTNWQTSNLFTGLATQTYTTYVHDVGSCFAGPTQDATISISNPILANAGPDAIICEGTSTQLAGSGGVLYSWSPLTGLSNSEIPNPLASPAVPTTYTLTVTDANGNCQSTDDVFVDVLPGPAVAITPLDRNICLGDVITLNAIGGVSYRWILDPEETTASITKSPTVTIGYTVEVTGSNGCTVDSTAIVMVHPLPTAVLSGDATICSGAPANLSVTLTGTAPWQITYTDGSTPVTVQADVSPFVFQVFPTSTTSYTLVSVTDYYTCPAEVISGSAVVTVTSLPTVPTATTVDHDDFCPGGFPDIILTASGGSGTSVNWYRGSCLGTLVGTGAQVTIPSPAVTTTYYASNVNGCGISSCKSITVTLRTAPTAPTFISTGSDPTSYCIGSSMPFLPYTLQANGAVNATGYEWFLNGSCGVGSPVASGPSNTLSITTPAVTTNYYVRSTNTNGCKSSNCAILQIVVYPPSVGGTINGTTEFCGETNSGVLTLSGYTGNILRWESTINGGANWISIGNANSNTYTYLNLTQSTLYRAFVQSGTCGAVYSSTASITINPLPVPVITGPASACLNSGSNTYATQVGMSNYTWTIAGGTITAGTGTNSVTVTWNTTGTQSISVTYTDAKGCNPIIPTAYPVNVRSLPVPTISGAASACLNSTGNVYTTEVGMTNYTWTITGGTITAGAGTRSATVTWNTSGAESISVTYTDANGCNPIIPTAYPVNILPLPLPTISGVASACLNSIGNVYTTEPGMSAYSWTIAGGTITAGAGTSSVTVTWNTAGAQSISVTYTAANGCNPITPTAYPVNVLTLPVPTISGPAFVCKNGDNIYTTEAGMSSYTWSLGGPGGTFPSGNGTNPITVRWGSTGTKTLKVIYTDANGCTASSANFSVTVQNPPVAPTSLTSPSSYTYCALSPPVGNYELYANNGIQADNTLLPATPGVTYEWFKDSGCGSATEAVTSQNRLTLPTAPVATTTYWVRIVNACGVSTCVNRTITVNDPSVPTGNASQTFCAANNPTVANLSATGTALKWYAASIGGAALSTSTALVNGNHYYASQTVGGCESSTRLDVTATVNAASVGGAISGSTTVCAGTNNTVLTLTGNTGNVTKWQSSTVSDFSSAVTDIANTTTTLTATNLATTTYYRAVVQSGVCASANSSTATVTVNIPAIPANLSATPTTIAYGQSSILSANVGGGEILEWFTGSCGGTAVTSPVSPTVTTIYYARAKNTTTGCISACANITITVVPACPADFSVCYTAAPFSLEGLAQPLGGTFAGVGVLNNIFTPSTAGTGAHTIKYSLSNQLIAYWNFNTAQPANTISWGIPIAANNGIGNITAGNWTWNNPTYTSNFAGNINNSLFGAPAGTSLGLMNSIMNKNYIQIQFSMSNLTDLVLSYYTEKSNTGFNNNQWSYSIDGGTNFVPFGDPINPTTTGSVFTLTGPSALNGITTVYLRYTLDGATGTGTNRIDNLQLNALPAGSGLCTFNITVDNPTLPTSGGDQDGCAASPMPVLTATATVAPGLSLVWYDAPIGGNVVINPTLSSLGSVTYYAASYTPATGCYSSARTPVLLRIFTPPVVTCPVNIGTCINTPAFNLTGAIPSGGTYSGDGVSAGKFDPSVAGTGSHTITYTYSHPVELLAYWNFNTVAAAGTIPWNVSINANSGSGSGKITTGNWTWNNILYTNNFTGSTSNSLNGDLSGTSLSLINQTMNGNFIQVEFNMNGLTDLVISYWTQKTGTGFNSNQWSWSTNSGGPYTNFGGVISPSLTPGSVVKLIGPSALNGATNVYLRYTLNGNSSNAGNNRIDNLQISAGNACSNSCDYTVTVNPTPIAPISASSDRNILCSDAGGNITLTATGGSGTTLHWFSGSCGGTSRGTGNNLSVAAPTVTTTYYARWETADCGNSGCTAVTVSVMPLPAKPTLSPNPACEGTTTFTAGNGSIYEFTIGEIVQQAASSSSTFTPATPPAAGQSVCVTSYPAPPFTFDGNLTETVWGSPLATNIGGADPNAPCGFGMGNILNAIYMQSDQAFLYGGIAGNLDGENRILLFIDCKPAAGYDNLSTWTNRVNAYDYSVEKLNSGITFDPGFYADYILIINKAVATGLVYYDLYNMSADNKTPLGYAGLAGSGLLGYQAAGNNTDPLHGFEFALPRSVLGSPVGPIKVFGMIVNNPGPSNPTTLLSNQYLTKANSGECNFGYGAVNFGVENPNPISIFLSNENCSSQKCVTVSPLPTTSAIYHQ